MPDTAHPVEPEELMAYLDGELPPARAAEAAEHLESCADCQRLAADLRGVSRQLMAWEVEAPSTLAAPRLEKGERWGRRPRLPGWRWMTAAAVCVCVLLVAVNELTVKKLSHPQFQSFLELPQPAPASQGRRPIAVPEPVAAPAPAPMIARTAQLTLTTHDVAKARETLDEILKRHHSYIGQLNIASPTGASRTLDATLRVPAAELEATLADLKKLGHVEQESQAGEEVTQQYVDLDARLTNARNAEQRLTALLRDRAGKMQDVLSVENEITRVRGEIETMDAQKKNLGARVEFASVKLTVTEEYKAQLNLGPGSSWTRLGNAAVEGYRSMVDSLLGVAQWLLSVGPSLLLWSLLLFWPVRAGWRRVRRSR